MAGPVGPAVLPHLPGQPLPDQHEHLSSSSGRLSGKLVQAMMARHGNLLFVGGAVGSTSAAGGTRGGSETVLRSGSRLAPRSSLPVLHLPVESVDEVGSMLGRAFSDGHTSEEITRSRGSAEMARSLAGAPLMSLAADEASGPQSGLKVAKSALNPRGPQTSGSSASDMAAAAGDADQLTSDPSGSGKRHGMGIHPVPPGVALLQQSLRIREEPQEIAPATDAGEGGRAGAPAIVPAREDDGNGPKPQVLIRAPPVAAHPAVGGDGMGIISHEGLCVSLKQSDVNIIGGGSVKHHSSGSSQLKAAPPYHATATSPLSRTAAAILPAAAAAATPTPPPPMAAATTGPVFDDWMSEWGAAAAAGEAEGEQTEAALPSAVSASRGDLGITPVGVAMKLSISSKVIWGSIMHLVLSHALSHCTSIPIPHCPLPLQCANSMSPVQSMGAQSGDTNFVSNTLTGKTGSLIYMAPEVSA